PLLVTQRKTTGRPTHPKGIARAISWSTATDNGGVRFPISCKEFLQMSTAKRHTGWTGSLRSAWSGRPARAASKPRARLSLEPFEDRLVLAAAAVLDPSLGLRTVVSG